MTKRIFRSVCLVALGVFLACLTVIFGVLYSFFSQAQIDQLRDQTGFAARVLQLGGTQSLQYLEQSDYRVTWVNTDGTVLYDSLSSPEQMENHLVREEIREALDTGTGESIRYSATLMEQIIYTAERLPDGTVLRLSMPRHTVLTLLLGMAQPIILVIILAAVLSLWLAHRISYIVVQPLNDLDLDHPAANDRYPELDPILTRISSQQRQLLGQQAELDRRKREFDTITNNMSEGLVLVSEQRTVLTMNPAAARILGLVRPFVGISFNDLTHADAIRHLVEQALDGQHGEESLSIGGKDFQLDASTVRTGEHISGAVLLMFDVTEKHRAEEQRREFTANVSHELKTPLHTISGYAELLKSGLVQPEDVPEFSSRIYGEAQRMIRLVEDILKLSHLDEATGPVTLEPVELMAAADAALKGLAPAARNAGIRLELEGDRCTVSSNPMLLNGILVNLITNAIKYNRPGGTVSLRIRQVPAGSLLTVADTGIGIPPEHQSRIFERFYRVDKSHSKSVGGTGLGLSIVKHSALVLGIRLGLKSTVGTGTEISLLFPKS